MIDMRVLINHRQLAWLTAVVLMSGGAGSIHQQILVQSRMDAWSSYFIPILYACMVAWFFYFLHRMFPGKSIFDIFMIVAGPLIGRLLTLLMLVYIGLLLIRDLGVVSQITKAILLPETPVEISLILLLFALIQFGRASIEGLARFNDVFFPFFVIAIFVVPFLLIDEFSANFIRPVLTQQPFAILSSNLLMTGWYGDMFVMGAFLGTIASSKQFLASAKHGILIASVVMTIYVGLEVVVLNPYVASNMVYPLFTLIQQINLGDFLDRFDLVVLSLWFPTTFVKVAIFHSALLIGLASLFKSRQYVGFSMQSGLVIVMIALLAFRNNTELYMYCTFGTLAVCILFQLPVMALMGLLVMVKKRKSPPAYAGDVMPSKENANSARLRLRLSISGWRWVTRSLLVGCACSLVIGLVLSQTYPAIGNGCGIAYGVFLFLLLFSTFMEMERSL